MASNSITTSARRFERIAKEIVRQDVESQIDRNFRQQFFIDKSVFDRHLPGIIETMDDASLSNFFLKYELSIHTTELVRYFSPQSSSKRDFVNLKYLSGQYGYHLCYMALREAARSNQETRREIANIVENMEQTALDDNITPPDDLFQDPFLTLSSSSRVNPARPTTESDNVPSGQGESIRHFGHFEGVGDTLTNLKMQQAIRTSHVDPISIAEMLRNMHVREPQEFEPEEKSENDRRPNEMQRRLSAQHLQGCQCATCINRIVTQVVAKVSPFPSTDEEEAAGMDEGLHQIHTGIMSGHIQGCTCCSCLKATQSQRNNDQGYDNQSDREWAERIRRESVLVPVPLSVSEEGLSKESSEMIISCKIKAVDPGLSSFTVSTTTQYIQFDSNNNTIETNDHAGTMTEEHNDDFQPWHQFGNFHRSRIKSAAQSTLNNMPDELDHSRPLTLRSFSTIHLGDCNCTSCVFIKQQRPYEEGGEEGPSLSVLRPHKEGEDEGGPPLSLWISNSTLNDNPSPFLDDQQSRSNLSSFEGIQESLEFISTQSFGEDGNNTKYHSALIPNNDSYSLSTIVNVKEDANEDSLRANERPLLDTGGEVAKQIDKDYKEEMQYRGMGDSSSIQYSRDRNDETV